MSACSCALLFYCTPLQFNLLELCTPSTEQTSCLTVRTDALALSHTFVSGSQRDSTLLSITQHFYTGEITWKPLSGSRSGSANSAGWMFRGEPGNRRGWWSREVYEKRGASIRSLPKLGLRDDIKERPTRRTWYMWKDNIKLEYRNRVWRYESDLAQNRVQ
jgi:hypothetical protein